MSTLTKYCQFHVLSTYAKVFSERKPISLTPKLARMLTEGCYTDRQKALIFRYFGYIDQKNR